MERTTMQPLPAFSFFLDVFGKVEGEERKCGIKWAARCGATGSNNDEEAVEIWGHAARRDDDGSFKCTAMEVDGRNTENELGEGGYGIHKGPGIDRRDT